MPADGATPYANRRRRSVRARLTLATFAFLPVAELLVLIAVGQQIGAGPTLAILLGVALVGGWIIRHEGRRTWQALRASADSGQLPGRETSNAVLVLLGGVLLLVPGFITDVLGLVCILPPTRPLARRVFQATFAGSVVVVPGTRPPGWPPAGGGASGAGSRGSAGAGDAAGQIVEGEIVDDGSPGRHHPDRPEGDEGGNSDEGLGGASGTESPGGLTDGR